MGPPSVLERFGGVGESDPAGLAVPATALPARPVNGLSLSLFFFAASVGAGVPPEPYFFAH